jgi:probable HAF family extracellular repeat protein
MRTVTIVLVVAVVLAAFAIEFEVLRTFEAHENEKMSIMKRLSARAAYAINDTGDVVGLIETARGGGAHTDHGFLFSDNLMIDIVTLDGDVNSVSIPAGINRARQIVGVAWKNGNSEQRAFLWENGVFHELPLLGPPPGYDLHYSAASSCRRPGALGDASLFYREGGLVTSTL